MEEQKAHVPEPRPEVGEMSQESFSRTALSILTAFGIRSFERPMHRASQDPNLLEHLCD